MTTLRETLARAFRAVQDLHDMSAPSYTITVDEYVDAAMGAIKEAASPPPFPLANRFTVGERICIPGYSGSYPDHSKNQWGYATEIRRDLTISIQESLIVTLDGEEPKAINPDVVGHGDDWRWRSTDPNLKDLHEKTWPDNKGNPIDYDPTYGRIDRDIQWKVAKEIAPTLGIGRRVAMEHDLQEKRNANG